MSAKISIELEFLVAIPNSQIEPSEADNTEQRMCLSSESSSPFVCPDSQQLLRTTNTTIVEVCGLLARSGVPVCCAVRTLWDRTKVDPLLTDTERFQIGDEEYVAWNSRALPEMYRGDKSSYWFVTEEFLNTMDHVFMPNMFVLEGYQWHAIEINSPILFDAAEFTGRLPTIRRLLSSLRANMKIWVNSTVGMHIHASPATARVDLRVARRVAALAMLLEEPVFYPMCHPYRKSSIYSSPISTLSLIASGRASYDGNAANTESTTILGSLVHSIAAAQRSGTRFVDSAGNMMRMVTEVLEQNTLYKLKSALGVLRGGGDPEDADRAALAITDYGTIEFRYPEASFDVDFINFWVALAQKVLEISSRPLNEFAHLYQMMYIMAIKREKADLETWLVVLGLTQWMDICRSRQRLYSTTLADLDEQEILQASDEE